MTAPKVLLLGFCLTTSCLGQGAIQNKPQNESLLIGPGDLLNVRVFETPDLTQSPRVTDSGTVPLMLVGDLKVQGMTPAQAASAIEQKLVDKHFMLHPVVTVTVSEYATQNISVLGQVKSPGSYPVTAPRTVIDMIAVAGGVTDSADRRITVEHRNDPTQKV